MNKIWKISIVIFTLLLWSATNWASAEDLTENGLSSDELAMAFLEDIDFADLQHVEVSLDDAFDVFDGLVKKRRTDVASGLKQSTQRAPAVTSVITAQDIEVMGARTIEEALQSVPGLQVSYNWYNVPTYTIRGISSTYNPEVLVLVNGFRMNDNFSGGKTLFWSGFPVSAISRVEVIRGPGSAVYGADAFAGVINIVTKNAQDIDGTEVGTRVGSYNTQDGWVTHGSEWNGFEIAAMADFSNTDGHQRIVESDAQTVWDNIFGTNASLAPGEYGSELTTYDVRLDVAKQNWHFRTGFHKADHMGSGVGTAQAIDPTTPLNEEKFTADLTYNNPTITQNWGLEAQLNYLHSKVLGAYQIFPPDAFGGAYPIGYIGHPSYSETQTQFALSSIYHGLENHIIRVGAGYIYYDLYKVASKQNFGLNPFTGGEILPTEFIDIKDTFAVYMPEVNRDDRFAFIQDTWTISPHWELTAGVRYDDYSDFGSTTNPRLGLVWETYPNLVTKLLYGRAFRAPSFQELYNQNNPVTHGNPNLEPETIETWELAFDYRITNTLHTTLNLFRYEIKDKIVLVPINVSESGYANAASWEGQGGEFELRWKTSNKSSLLFNYSYQDSEDNTGATLMNGSQQAAYLRGDYLIGSKWYLDAQINWNDGWARAANDLRPDLEGYTTTDLILRRKDIRGGNTNFAVGVRNLFDTDVRYPSPGPDNNGMLNVPNDLPGLGRFYFVEFRYKFK